MIIPTVLRREYLALLRDSKITHFFHSLKIVHSKIQSGECFQAIFLRCRQRPIRKYKNFQKLFERIGCFRSIAISIAIPVIFSRLHCNPFFPVALSPPLSPCISTFASLPLSLYLCLSLSPSLLLPLSLCLSPPVSLTLPPPPLSQSLYLYCTYVYCGGCLNSSPETGMSLHSDEQRG